MTSETRQASLRGRIAALEERFDAQAKQNEELLEALKTTFGNVNKQLSEAVETLNAVVASVGADEVAKLVVEERQKRATEEAEQRKATLKSMVDAKLFAKADVISDKSVIVGQESDKDGKVLVPGYAQLRVDQVKPEFQTLLRGQAVGYVLETPNGKLTVTEIWDFVDPPAGPPAAEPTPTEPVAPKGDPEVVTG